MGLSNLVSNEHHWARTIGIETGVVSVGTVLLQCVLGVSEYLGMIDVEEESLDH